MGHHGLGLPQLPGVGLLLLVLLAPGKAAYLAGVGVADITGPVADVNLMGYAKPMQTAQGLHTRLYARAFVIADAHKPETRFAYVQMDAAMSSQLVTMRVIQKLKAEYGDLYSTANVAISGTHTHASPAGFLQYLLYTITSLGFVQASFGAMVEGIAQAVRSAHASLRPAELYLSSGALRDASINRSPTAYLANPQEERDRYDSNVDTELALLRLVDAGSGADRAALTWFAVHCTSLNNTNRLVSGDNKGAAQVLLEDWARGQAKAQQQGQRRRSLAAASFDPGFVAAFAQGSVGDTSPNTQGAFCTDTGLPCDPWTSTCNGKNEQCHGRGPAWPDDRASALVIGQRQADKARELMTAEEGQALLSGPLDYRHTFLDMSNTLVAASKWTRAGRTCPPAMGMSFAAGTTDGPGALDFTQGDTKGTALWRMVRRFIKAPSAQQEACQAPKPILLDTGEITSPYLWQPKVTEVALLRVGSLLVACVPGEFTTMAGRRLKAALSERVSAAWGPMHVVLSGLTNTYSSYVTTYEEYQVQRYEGASTLYGPHTLDAYIQEFLRLADAMLAGKPAASSASPPDLYAAQIGLLTPVVVDWVPPGSSFGDVTHPPKAKYRIGDTVSVTFRAGNPRNNLRTGQTFMAVERQTHGSAAADSGRRLLTHGAPHAGAAAAHGAGVVALAAAAGSAGADDGESTAVDGTCAGADGAWETVYTDRDWITRFKWTRPFKLSPQSSAAMEWDIAEGTMPGMYRIHYYGDYKSLLGTIRSFEGCSPEFEVVGI